MKLSGQQLRSRILSEIIKKNNIYINLTLAGAIQVVQLTLQFGHDQLHVFIAGAGQRFHPLFHLRLGLGAQRVRAIVDTVEDNLEAILFGAFGELCTKKKQNKMISEPSMCIKNTKV